MARGRVYIRQLINEARLDVDTAILMLLDSDLKFESEDQIVPKSLLARVRTVLDLPTHPPKRKIEVTKLGQRTEKSEAEVRDLLYKSGLLPKRRLKYLPKNALTTAEQLLGLREIPIVPSSPESHRK